MLTKEQIIKLGWVEDHDLSLSTSTRFRWHPGVWNGPELFIVWETMRVEITIFKGYNDWYGKMDRVFNGYLEDVRSLKLIMKAVRLNDYYTDATRIKDKYANKQVGKIFKNKI